MNSQLSQDTRLPTGGGILRTVVSATLAVDDRRREPEAVTRPTMVSAGSAS